MNTEEFVKYYVDPLNHLPGAPPPQLFKDLSVLKITPEEGAYDANRTTYTFINKNLDIITMPSEAYLYVTATHATGEANEAATMRVNSVSIPSSAGLVEGFDYLINDTSICTRNNSLAKTLYATNHGVSAPEHRSLHHIGLGNYDTGPFNQQIDKIGQAGKSEWKIPLKYIIPFLKENKILWGVKQTLKITRAQLDEVLYLTNGDTVNGGTTVSLTSLELRMPYVKLEAETQLTQMQNMYNKTIDRYWLDVDQFWSSVEDNKVKITNNTFRVATKGLNSRPRWLLLHAIDASAGIANDAKHMPMGFGLNLTAGRTGKDTKNTIRFEKIRVKVNGMYIDNGDVLEMSNVPSGNGAVGDVCAAGNDPWRNHMGYMRPYEDYCRFFGQYSNERPHRRSFNAWLQQQVYVFDLNNIDTEQIFQNSGSAMILEIEYSTQAGAGTQAGVSPIKLVANVLYDKRLAITHSENKATLMLT